MMFKLFLLVAELGPHGVRVQVHLTELPDHVCHVHVRETYTETHKHTLKYKADCMLHPEAQSDRGRYTLKHSQTGETYPETQSDRGRYTLKHSQTGKTYTETQSDRGRYTLKHSQTGGVTP